MIIENNHSCGINIDDMLKLKNNCNFATTHIFMKEYGLSSKCKYDYETIEEEELITNNYYHTNSKLVKINLYETF